jgi:hypothetical protein
LFMTDTDEPDPATPRARPAVPARDSPLYRAVVEPRLSQANRTALGKAASAAEWNTYLLSSPDFNYR